MKKTIQILIIVASCIILVGTLAFSQNLLKESGKLEKQCGSKSSVKIQN
jgi:hypothetical protein